MTIADAFLIYYLIGIPVNILESIRMGMWRGAFSSQDKVRGTPLHERILWVFAASLIWPAALYLWARLIGSRIRRWHGKIWGEGE